MGDRNGDCVMRGLEDILMRLKQWPDDWRTFRVVFIAA
jgi:hypothetical protein